MTPGKIYIGTSGWVYKDWAKNFYPKEIPKKRHLGFYATRFPTVEIKRFRVARVWVSSLAMPFDFEVTAAFVYVRFHGLDGGTAHDYTDEELEPWAEHLRRCAHQGLSGFVYFNNDVNTRAPHNALRLMQMLGKYAQRPGVRSDW